MTHEDKGAAGTLDRLRFFQRKMVDHVEEPELHELLGLAISTLERLRASDAAASAMLGALQTLVAALPEDGEWEHFLDIKQAARAAITQVIAAGVTPEPGR